MQRICSVMWLQLPRLVPALGLFLALCGAPAHAAWLHCADEGGYCGFRGTQDVRIGAGSNYIQGRLTGGVACSIGLSLGKDPAPGRTKSCEVNCTGCLAPPPAPAQPGFQRMHPVNAFAGYDIRIEGGFDDSYPKNIDWRIDDGPFTPARELILDDWRYVFSIPDPGLAPGTLHTLTVRRSDIPAIYATSDVFIVQPSPRPEITVGSVALGSGGSLVVSGSINGPQPKGLSWSVNGGPYRQAASPRIGGGTYTLVVLNPGVAAGSTATVSVQAVGRNPPLSATASPFTIGAAAGQPLAHPALLPDGTDLIMPTSGRIVGGGYNSFTYRMGAPAAQGTAMLDGVWLDKEGVLVEEFIRALPLINGTDFEVSVNLRRARTGDGNSIIFRVIFNGTDSAGRPVLRDHTARLDFTIP
jgi:hypothetical protein